MNAYSAVAVLTTCRQYLVQVERAHIEADRAHGTQAYSGESVHRTANFSGRRERLDSARLQHVFVACSRSPLLPPPPPNPPPWRRSA